MMSVTALLVTLLTLTFLIGSVIGYLIGYNRAETKYFWKEK